MIRQRRADIVHLRIDESAISGNTSAGILEGTHHAKIQKNGTGDYTITLNETGRRTLGVIGLVSMTTDVAIEVAAIDENSVQVVGQNGGTDTNCDFMITLIRFDAETQS